MQIKNFRNKNKPRNCTSKCLQNFTASFKGKLFLLCYATTWFACIAKPSISPVCCGEVCRVIVIKTASNINDPSTEKQLGTQVPHRPAAGITTISPCYQIIYRPIQKAILCDIYFLFNTEIKKKSSSRICILKTRV